jgi:hypothetical protein
MADEVVDLTARRKHEPGTTIVPDIPSRTLHQCEKNPQTFVDILKQCDGDVEEYLTQFRAVEHIARMKILTTTLLTLNRTEHSKLKAEWDALIDAYKQAKIALAERAAFQWIGNYNPPGINNPNAKITLQAAAVYMRMWLGEHMSSETTKGRRKGAETPTAETDAAASRIVDELMEAD